MLHYITMGWTTELQVDRPTASWRAPLGLWAVLGKLFNWPF
jgi:hypothetical protein